MENILIEYLQETIPEVEKLRLIQWLRTSRNQRKFKEFVKINHKLQKHYSEIDFERAYQETMAKIEHSVPEVSKNTDRVEDHIPYG